MATGPSRTLKLKYVGDASGLKRANDEASTSVEGFGSKVGAFGKKVAAVTAVAAAAFTALAVKVGKDAVVAASDLNEEIAKAGELFGESAGEIEAWAKTSAQAFGQSRRQAIQAAGNFAIFGRSAGLTGDELVKFSTDFTELASDLASFNNTSPEDAITAIGAALRGESEPIRRYGILLNDATLKQAALKLGIIETTKDALTPQQRVLAAQQAIYEQVGAAAGDFERTSDGLANTQRILTASIEDAKAALGEALLPVVNDVVGALAKAVPTLIEWSRELGTKLAPALENIRDRGKEFVASFGEWWKENGDDVKQKFENLRTSVEQLTTKVREFGTAAIAQIQEGGSVKRLEEGVGDLRRELGETRTAFDAMIASFSSEQTANGGKAFAFVIESLFINPLNGLKLAIEGVLNALQALFGFVGRLNDFKNSLPDRLAGFSGLSSPGVNLPSSSADVRGRLSPFTININSGVGDPEAIAREVDRILTSSARRTTYRAGQSSLLPS